VAADFLTPAQLRARRATIKIYNDKRRTNSCQRMPAWDAAKYRAALAGTASETLNPDVRNIYSWRRRGWTYQRIGDKYGLSRQRVHALCNRLIQIMRGR
jgi:hypothetical protein